MGSYRGVIVTVLNSAWSSADYKALAQQVVDRNGRSDPEPPYFLEVDYLMEVGYHSILDHEGFTHGREVDDDYSSLEQELARQKTAHRLNTQGKYDSLRDEWQNVIRSTYTQADWEELERHVQEVRTHEINLICRIPDLSFANIGDSSVWLAGASPITCLALENLKPRLKACREFRNNDLYRFGNNIGVAVRVWNN